MCRKGAPHHQALACSCRGQRFGRDDLWVTHPTWTRKREGTTAWRGSAEHRGGVEGVAVQGPRDMAKATLLEAQSPAMKAHIPRPQRLQCGAVGIWRRAGSRQNLPTDGAVRNDLTQGDGRDTYVTLETSSVKGMRDRPNKGRETQGDGAFILLSGRESRLQGEGRQVLTMTQGRQGTRDAKRRNRIGHHPRDRGR